MNTFRSFAVLFLLVYFLVGCDQETNDVTGPDPSDEDFVFVLNDVFKGEPVVIFYHPSFNVFAAYSRRLADGTILEFKNKKVPGLVELEDTEGNKWNYSGKAVSGNRLGTSLNHINSMKGLWLAISSFYQKARYPDQDKMWAFW